MTELLPCPFCGAKAVTLSGFHSWVECEGCCAKSTIARNSNVAAERWNRRAPIAEQSGPERTNRRCDSGQTIGNGRCIECTADRDEACRKPCPPPESRKNSRTELPADTKPLRKRIDIGWE